MAIDEGPKFGLGKTYFDVAGTVDTSSTPDAYMGFEKWFNDDVPSSTGGVSTKRSGNLKRMRLVKNSSGISLLPKMLVQFKAGTLRQEVDGYARIEAQGDVAVVDEHLPAAGVRNGDYFWVCVEGPTLVITNVAADATGSIPQGSLVVAATAAASTVSTTAGRVGVFTLTDTTVQATNARHIGNALGRAMTARTSGETNADQLIFLKNDRY